ncbi:hypothetical protein AJ80_10059 [Polytolypa hystricis UAMH7299]|uniref:Uncharacterized protein n=1 Tax=Polytolypa hystricis (strain UAMH7299) TaxID=1447883 RepID=A0A2B7WEK7_POLH7|nr:hypothetical protein AJ80_10059 [Polytolypa hystricis UAMH7299]
MELAEINRMTSDVSLLLEALRLEEDRRVSASAQYAINEEREPLVPVGATEGDFTFSYPDVTPSKKDGHARRVRRSTVLSEGEESPNELE